MKNKTLLQEIMKINKEVKIFIEKEISSNPKMNNKNIKQKHKYRR